MKTKLSTKIFGSISIYAIGAMITGAVVLNHPKDNVFASFLVYGSVASCLMLFFLLLCYIVDDCFVE